MVAPSKVHVIQLVKIQPEWGYELYSTTNGVKGLRIENYKTNKKCFYSQ
jgi:hypothetical protein